MAITDLHRRTLVSLACEVARADQVVRPEERKVVEAFCQRFARNVVDQKTLFEWLDHGPPHADIATLPPEYAELFLYEAMRITEIDGEIADVEVDYLRQLEMRLMEVRSAERVADNESPRAIAKIQPKRMLGTR